MDAAELVSTIITVITILIVARIVVSWIVLLAPSMRWLYGHPAVELLNSATNWILAPIRSVMPSFGGFDFSPMIAIILLQVIGSFLVSGLQG